METQMSKIIDLDVNLTFKSDIHGDVQITYIQYTLDGQKDYDTGDSSDGVTLLNKQVLLNGVRIDFNPSCINGWLDLMNQVDDFIFKYIFDLIESSKKNSEKILNLTQHPATLEQIAAGVIEPEDKDLVKYSLEFKTIPTKTDMIWSAVELVNLVKKSGCTKVMIGGAPFFMCTLEAYLIDNDIQPMYAFSERVSEEEIQTDGGVKKVSKFKHVGFVYA